MVILLVDLVISRFQGIRPHVCIHAMYPPISTNIISIAYPTHGCYSGVVRSLLLHIYPFILQSSHGGEDGCIVEIDGGKVRVSIVTYNERERQHGYRGGAADMWTYTYTRPHVHA